MTCGRRGVHSSPAAGSGWKTFEFAPSEAGHDVMVDAPQRLADILVQVA